MYFSIVLFFYKKYENDNRFYERQIFKMLFNFEVISSYSTLRKHKL